jgi:putative ABC transport system permease protein
MFRVTARNLLARKLRLAMSAFAIVLGVAFVAGSFVFTDTLDKSFQGIIDSTTGDVIIRPAGTDPNSSGQILDTRFIPGSVLDRAASVDGVARLDRNITIPQVFVVSKAGKVIGGQGPPSLGVNFTDAPGDNGEPLLQVIKGQAPTGPGEVALDKATADKAGYDVGDTVQLVTAGKSPRLNVTLVGIVTFGAEGGLLGATLSVFDTGAMQQLLFHGRDLYTDATVTTADGFSQTQVSKAISAVLPPTFEAVSGDAVAAESKKAIDKGLSFINTFLLVFAAVALVVGSWAPAGGRSPGRCSSRRSSWASSGRPSACSAASCLRLGSKPSSRRSDST